MISRVPKPDNSEPKYQLPMMFTNGPDPKGSIEPMLPHLAMLLEATSEACAKMSGELGCKRSDCPCLRCTLGRTAHYLGVFMTKYVLPVNVKEHFPEGHPPLPTVHEINDIMKSHPNIVKDHFAGPDDHSDPKGENDAQ